MSQEVSDFIDALLAYVRAEIMASGEPADYNTDAVCIVDARNHIFRPVGRRSTDEAENIYALRDLCRVDDATMEIVPDRGRCASVARNFFGTL